MPESSAHNILAKATAGMAGSNACGDETTVLSMKQETNKIEISSPPACKL